MNDDKLRTPPKRPGDLRFDDSEKANFKPGGKLHNCYFSAWGGKFVFAVRQYLAGTSRVLGRFTPDNEYHAARFADCCLLHFWKYRKVNREPCNADFNFSLELAEQTIAHPEVAAVLSSVESHLVQKYNLRPRIKSWHFADKLETLRRWGLSWKEFAELSNRLVILTPPDGDLKHVFRRLQSTVEDLASQVRYIEKQVLTLNKNSVEYSNEQQRQQQPQSEPRESTEPAAANHPATTGETG